jgi:hypothetical protein
MSFTQKVLSTLISKIGEFCPHLHEWSAPEKLTLPALVYRIEQSKRTPLRFKKWRTFSDRTRWAVAKVELNIHLFWIDKEPSYGDLDNFLKKWTAFYLDGERIKLKYEPFAPFREEEFIKKELHIWNAVLTAELIEFLDTEVLEISVEAKES